MGLTMTDTPLNMVTAFQIPADNVERAWSFYEAVFGWTPERVYRDEKHAGAIGGDIRVRSEYLSVPRLVISVSDIGRTIATIKAAGGSVITGTDDNQGTNRTFAIIKDTEGNLLNIIVAGACERQ